jgi:hypothetical protein
MAYLDSSVDQAVFDTYSQGRALAGVSLPVSQYAQWSAVVDAKTCDFCSWADLRIFDTNIEPWDPPLHFGCRCIIAYIKSDEYTPDPNWGSGPPNTAFPPGKAQGKTPGKTIAARKFSVQEVAVEAKTREAAFEAATELLAGTVVQATKQSEGLWLVTVEVPVAE